MLPFFTSLPFKGIIPLKKTKKFYQIRRKYSISARKLDFSTRHFHHTVLFTDLQRAVHGPGTDRNAARQANGTAAVPSRAQRKMSAMMDIFRFTSITIAKSASASASGRKTNAPSAARPHTLSAQNR